MKQRLNCVLFCEDGDDPENKTDNDYEESGMEGGSMTRSRNELEEDAVEDYIDSDDDVNSKNVNKRCDTNQKGLHEEETESESDESGSSDVEENDDNDKDTDESDDDEGSGAGDDDGNVIASKRRRT